LEEKCRLSCEFVDNSEVVHLVAIECEGVHSPDTSVDTRIPPCQ